MFIAASQVRRRRRGEAMIASWAEGPFVLLSHC